MFLRSARGDTIVHKWKGSLFGWCIRLAACRAGTRYFCSALAVLVGSQVQNMFFLTISISLSPSHCKPGKHPCWVACLLACVSGWTPPHLFYPLSMLNTSPPLPCLLYLFVYTFLHFLSNASSIQVLAAPILQPVYLSSYQIFSHVQFVCLRHSRVEISKYEKSEN